MQDIIIDNIKYFYNDIIYDNIYVNYYYIASKYKNRVKDMIKRCNNFGYSMEEFKRKLSLIIPNLHYIELYNNNNIKIIVILPKTSYKDYNKYGINEFIYIKSDYIN